MVSVWPARLGAVRGPLRPRYRPSRAWAPRRRGPRWRASTSACRPTQPCWRRTRALWSWRVRTASCSSGSRRTTGRTRSRWRPALSSPTARGASCRAGPLSQRLRARRRPTWTRPGV